MRVLPIRSPDGNVVQPVDSAGLVLIREAADGPRVLLGRRSRNCRFMPGAYVMPGGRVERADRAPSGFPEALAPAPRGADAGTRDRLAVFARAALREFFEETGLLAAASRGEPDGCRLLRATAGPEDAAWRAFERAGAEPAFGALRLVARAITPIRSPIRFHTRFFMAVSRDRRSPPVTAPPGPDGEVELEELEWVSMAEMNRLPVAEASALALREAFARHARHGGTADRGAADRGARTRSSPSTADEPAPCFTWRGRGEHLWRTPAPEPPAGKA